MAESKGDYLKTCFIRIVDGMQVKLDIGVIRHIIRKELQVDLNSLSPILAKALPYFLVYHIKHWPGWNKSGEFYAKKLIFLDWYGDFIDYLKAKLDDAINLYFKEICNELRIEPGLNSYADKSTQTEDLIPKGLAPFQIEVFGGPHLLNNIIFTDSVDNGVALKHHRATKWSSLDLANITMKQLLTWPHIGVQMYSPILSLSRKNLHKFTRYIRWVRDIPLSEPSNFIERISNQQSIHKSELKACYTVDYFKNLVAKWLTILSASNMYPDYLEVLQVIMQEFISDIEEIGILRNGKPVLASNSSVLFNIGKSTYIRNKKASKHESLAYTEIITPLTETTITEIRSEAQITRYLGRVKKLSETSKIGPVLPQIKFMCTFCNVTLPVLQKVLEHFMLHHKMESSMTCVICKKNFLVMQLTEDRWGHVCDRSNSGLVKKN